MRNLMSVLLFVALSCVESSAEAEVLYAFTDLGHLEGQYCAATGINDSGQIVGWAGTWNYGMRRGFLIPPGLVLSPACKIEALGGNWSAAYAINASGWVAGFSTSPTLSQEHAFRMSPDGTTTDLGTLDGILPYSEYSGGMDIAPDGTVVGGCYMANGDYHAFRTTPNGKVSDPGADLGTFDGKEGPESMAAGINASGQVTGYSWGFKNMTWFQHAFRTSPGGFIYDPGADLGSFGPNLLSEGWDINNLGQVVGRAQVSDSKWHAFRTSPTGLVSDPGTDLGTLGGNEATANAINNLGVTVGSSQTLSGDTHAFVCFADGVMRDLNDLVGSSSGIVLTEAFGINNYGQIVGRGLFGSQSHAFLLTPVPEPGTLAFLALGALFLRRRGR